MPEKGGGVGEVAAVQHKRLDFAFKLPFLLISRNEGCLILGASEQFCVYEIRQTYA